MHLRVSQTTDFMLGHRFRNKSIPSPFWLFQRLYSFVHSLAIFAEHLTKTQAPAANSWGVVLGSAAQPGHHTSLAVFAPQHSASQTPSVTAKMEDCTARRDRVLVEEVLRDKEGVRKKRVIKEMREVRRGGDENRKRSRAQLGASWRK